MKRLSDYYVVSDMDGTLLGPDGKIPPRNTEAIKRFIAGGGRFGIATGRSRALMLDLARGLPINAPCVLYNGGALYDFADDKILMQEFLPQQSEGYIRAIMEEYPEIGVMVISGDDYYQVNEERKLAEFVETRNQQHFGRCALETVARPWYKAIFQMPSDQREHYLAEFVSRKCEGVRFVGAAPTLIEMLPEQSSKGGALEELIKQGYTRRENLVAIGDFYNDVEMIELAGIGVTLETSPEDIKQKADLIVGDCANGAVADLIEYLEDLCAG